MQYTGICLLMRVRNRCCRGGFLTKDVCVWWWWWWGLGVLPSISLAVVRLLCGCCEAQTQSSAPGAASTMAAAVTVGLSGVVGPVAAPPVWNETRLDARTGLGPARALPLRSAVARVGRAADC